MENKEKGFKKYLGGIVCLIIVVAIFGGIGNVMGLPNMLNTIMKTAHDLLLNTVFYLMAICVITGALGRIFVEFGVVSLLERILRPLMKPLFNSFAVIQENLAFVTLKEKLQKLPEKPLKRFNLKMSNQSPSHLKILKNIQVLKSSAMALLKKMIKLEQQQGLLGQKLAVISCLLKRLLYLEKAILA